MSTVSEVDLGHDASIGSSVLNLSNTILGMHVCVCVHSGVSTVMLTCLYLSIPFC